MSNFPRRAHILELHFVASDPFRHKPNRFLVERSQLQRLRPISSTVPKLIANLAKVTHTDSFVHQQRDTLQ